MTLQRSVDSPGISGFWYAHSLPPFAPFAPFTAVSPPAALRSPSGHLGRSCRCRYSPPSLYRPQPEGNQTMTQSPSSFRRTGSAASWSSLPAGGTLRREHQGRVLCQLPAAGVRDRRFSLPLPLCVGEQRGNVVMEPPLGFLAGGLAAVITPGRIGALGQQQHDDVFLAAR